MARTNTTTKTQAQQAELDRLRAEKKARAATVAEHVEAVQPEPASADTEGLVNQFVERINELAKNMGFAAGIPSTKRVLVALFSSILLSGAAGYAIGKLAGYAIAGIVTMGGSMLWAWLIMITALILSFYAGMKIGQHVGNYILSGRIDQDVKAAKDKVTGWLGAAKAKVMPAKLVTA